MKLPFENFDESNSSQKLSFIEKTIIAAGVLFAKAALWKLGKAKTYGDILKLGEFIDTRVQDFGDSIPSLDDTKPNFKNILTDTLNEASKVTKEVKEL